MLQGLCGHSLKFWVNCGAYRHTTGKEFLFTKVSAELTTNFIGEIVTRWTLRFVAVVIAVLYG